MRHCLQCLSDLNIMLVTHSDGNADATKTSTYLGRPAQSGRHVGPDRTVRLRHDLGGMHRSLIENRTQKLGVHLPNNMSILCMKNFDAQL